MAGCVFSGFFFYAISGFTLLVDMPIAIISSAVVSKTKSIIIVVLISKALINSDISHNGFVLVNSVLKESKILIIEKYINTAKRFKNDY